MADRQKFKEPKIKLGSDHTKPGENPSYMDGSQAPFNCGHCEYFTEEDNEQGTCDKEEMEKMQGKSPAEVEFRGCCNYFEKR
jgi:hypothetical protein